MPRHLATCAADILPDPAGVLGTFAVTVPMGTTMVAHNAFKGCKGLAQVSMPPNLTKI